MKELPVHQEDPLRSLSGFGGPGGEHGELALGTVLLSTLLLPASVVTLRRAATTGKEARVRRGSARGRRIARENMATATVRSEMVGGGREWTSWKGVKVRWPRNPLFRDMSLSPTRGSSAYSAPINGSRWSHPRWSELRVTACITRHLGLLGHCGDPIHYNSKPAGLSRYILEITKSVGTIVISGLQTSQSDASQTHDQYNPMNSLPIYVPLSSLFSRISRAQQLGESIDNACLPP